LKHAVGTKDKQHAHDSVDWKFFISGYFFHACIGTMHLRQDCISESPYYNPEQIGKEGKVKMHQIKELAIKA